MQARIKQDARWARLNFFSGLEFTKVDWRDVPAGKEQEASTNEYLEVRDAAPVVATVVIPTAPKATRAALNTDKVIEAVEPAPVVETVTTDPPSETKTTTPDTAINNASNRNRHGSNR